jgi:UDP-N-acetylmuramoylalanine--D-glutamate ligase
VLWLRRAGREIRLIEASLLSLPGPHNVENALAAAVLVADCPLASVLPPAAGPEPAARGTTPADPILGGIVASLSSFGGLPHRLQPAGTVRGIRFVNDSKATNTDSLAVALAAYAEPVVLIAGGRGKGQDFRPLRDLIGQKVSRLVLIGEAAGTLERDWSGVPLTRAGSLEEAVSAAFASARPGQTVLLSPACASFDMFANYEDRGHQFCEAVARLGRRTAEGGAAS